MVWGWVGPARCHQVWPGTWAGVPLGRVGLAPCMLPPPVARYLRGSCVLRAGWGWPPHATTTCSQELVGMQELRAVGPSGVGLACCHHLQLQGLPLPPQHTPTLSHSPYTHSPPTITLQPPPHTHTLQHSLPPYPHTPPPTTPPSTILPNLPTAPTPTPYPHHTPTHTCTPNHSPCTHTPTGPPHCTHYIRVRLYFELFCNCL